MAIKIKTILLERKMTIKELSNLINTSAGNLGNKLRRDNLSIKELSEIAEALNCDFDGTFTLRDTGKKI
ncbi:MAG: helix-turn-helix transcriptional regulator [Clostridia bacterium]